MKDDPEALTALRMVHAVRLRGFSGISTGNLNPIYNVPTRAFANTTASSDAPALAYVAVYPLTMLLFVS